MSDIANKKYQILVHTITFNIIVFNQQKLKNAGAALVITIISIYSGSSCKRTPTACEKGVRE